MTTHAALLVAEPSVVRHKRIQLVVLEEHIRTVALHHRLVDDFLVWPMVLLEAEAAAVVPWQAPARLRIAWVGTANRHKGVDDFIALHRSRGALYD